MSSATEEKLCYNLYTFKGEVTVVMCVFYMSSKRLDLLIEASINNGVDYFGLWYVYSS